MQSSHTVSYASSINQSLFSSKSSVGRNHSILSRTSLRQENRDIQTYDSKRSVDELSALFNTRNSKEGLVTWSEQGSPPYQTNYVAIHPSETQRNSESVSAFSVDHSIYGGRSEATTRESIVQSVRNSRSPKPVSNPIDELEGLFGNQNQTNQQLASVFSYGNAISMQPMAQTKEKIRMVDSLDSETAFTEKEEETEEWVYQRNRGTLEKITETTLSKETENETGSTSTKMDSFETKKPSLFNAFKGKWSKQEKEESKALMSEDTDSSYSISFEASSYSETITSRRSHTSNSQTLVQTEYCQFFGCHRTIAPSSVDKNRCKLCSFLFCDEVRFLFLSH